jgi:tripartite-type tricarboxylate transporter receptor subunit TctC
MLPRLLLAVFAIAALPPTAAPAQQYPTQAIKIIVPNPAGGLPDTLSRIVGKRLQERLGQPVVIENRPGANAGIGTAALTASAPDGYTFLMTDSAVFAISPLIYLKLPYNPKEAMPAAFVATAPIWLAANAKIPASTIQVCRLRDIKGAGDLERPASEASIIFDERSSRRSRCGLRTCRSRAWPMR